MPLIVPPPPSTFQLQTEPKQKPNILSPEAVQSAIEESLGKLKILSVELNALSLYNQHNQTSHSLQRYQAIYSQYQSEFIHSLVLTQYLYNNTIPATKQQQTSLVDIQKNQNLQTIEEGEDESDGMMEEEQPQKEGEKENKLTLNGEKSNEFKPIRPTVEFVKDVTVPDRSHYSSNKSLTKTWAMRNSGESAWGNDVELVYFKGDKSLCSKTRYFVNNAAPKEEILISANIQTPNDPGRYCTYFRLQKNGKFFGPRLWVDIIVDPQN